jgi:hypothetical protein
MSGKASIAGKDMCVWVCGAWFNPWCRNFLVKKTLQNITKHNSYSSKTLLKDVPKKSLLKH